MEGKDRPVPHIGPVEGKILQGNDKRYYALEMVSMCTKDMRCLLSLVCIYLSAQNEYFIYIRIYVHTNQVRLTPRDANYVPKYTTVVGGTGNIAEESLAKVDKDLACTYVIRHELIPLYLQVLYV